MIHGMSQTSLTTRLPGLDEIVAGLHPGDVVTWQIDAVEEYRKLVAPFAAAARCNGRQLLYFRFAGHEPLLPPDSGATVYALDPAQGFENFIAAVHAAIERAGSGVFVVCDCLSRLAADWYSDQMLASFVQLTVPRLREQGGVAYLALYRNYHTANALDPIRAAAPLFIDVFRHRGEIYLRPVKADQRRLPTQHMFHVWRGDEFRAVTASAVLSEILTTEQWSGLASDSGAGFWETTFIRARELVQAGDVNHGVPGRAQETFHTLVKMIVSRDPGMQKLLTRHLTLPDVLDVRRRMIGTGLIGGKAVGLLLARAIVKQADPRFAELLEEHDSFFVGSDVFYDFLVRSGAWPIRQKQRNPNTFLEGADEARRLLLAGEFAPHVLRQLEEMLDYFGQSPFIVRSSSLLEDNYGNAFAGTYESVFCANQGPREERLQNLLAAIREIYASSMSEKALRYRADRGMLDRDEQMALLVMRVSGTLHGQYFYPQLAGVGFSFNPYAWAPDIDPQAGVARLVFGLGTRAVNRSDDDYTRIVALNAPGKRPETNFDEVAQFAQRRMDFLDLAANRLASDYFSDVVRDGEDLPLDLLTTEAPSPHDSSAPPNRVLTFDALLTRTNFVRDLCEMLHALQTAYCHPVDIEFTANFLDPRRYKINLLQCRPLQIQGTSAIELPEISVAPEDLILSARGAVVGQSRVARIDRLVYVSPDIYSQLPLQDRHEIARVVGEINRAGGAETTLLVGPGRWGSTSPHLGIPVNFHQINRVAILCEIVAMHAALVPDVSLGTHFLSELLERNVLHLALFPDQHDNAWNRDFFETAPNRLADLVPAATKWAAAIRVIDVDRLPGHPEIQIAADARRQTVKVFFKR